MANPHIPKGRFGDVGWEDVYEWAFQQSLIDVSWNEFISKSDIKTQMLVLYNNKWFPTGTENYGPPKKQKKLIVLNGD